LAAIGKIATAVQSAGALDENQRVRLIRVVFSLFQYAVFMALAWVVLRRRSLPEASMGLLLLATVAVSPLAISTSIILYTDGFYGAFAAGAVALVVLMREQKILSRKTATVLAAVAALVFGLAKPEWNVALLIAAGVGLVFSVLGRDRKDGDLLFFSALVFGCLCGMALSYVVAPDNFVYHVKLVFGLRNSARMDGLDILSPEFRPLFFERAWLLTPLITLLLASLVWLAMRRNPLSTFLVAFAALLFFGYASSLSIKHFEFRYFTPALIVACVAGVGLAPAKPKRWAGVLMLVICLVLGALFLSHNTRWIDQQLSATFGYGYPVKSYFPNESQIVRAAKQYKCVPVLPAWTKYRYPDSDFILPSLDFAEAEKFVAKNGGKICK
jgi:hypothetical protein